LLRRRPIPPSCDLAVSVRAAARRTTEILVYKVYRDDIEGLDLGGSSAQSVILMLLVITLTVLQFRYVVRRVQYQ
jgi:ABC-type sugar transport system permease subunit